MSKLLDLGSKLFNPRAEFRPKIVAVSKRIRGVLDGKFIFDTTRARLVWENGFYPLYWIPKSDFLESVVQFVADKPMSGIESSTYSLSLVAPSPSRPSSKSISALVVPDSFNSELAGLVKIDFDSLDAWYEEQSRIYYHPRDPFHRVDVLPSGRHVKVEIDGVVVADTGSEGGVMSLWETNFPGRWYLPRTSINWEYLMESPTTTGCPYKGAASYYSAVINGKEYKDVAWWYQTPIIECSGITGMLCFYPDKVDTSVDGKPLEKIGMPTKKMDVEAKREPVEDTGGCNHC